MPYRLNIPSPPSGSLKFVEKEDYRDEDVVEEDIFSPYGPSDSDGLEVLDDEDVETLASRPLPDPNRSRLAMNQTCLYLTLGLIASPHPKEVTFLANLPSAKRTKQKTHHTPEHQTT